LQSASRNSHTGPLATHRDEFTDPVTEFMENEKYLNDVICPNDEGIVPVNSFAYSMRTVNLGILLAQVEGIVPDKAL
jgi:hypothetical protein